MIRAATLTAAYRPRPPRNVRALVVTAAAAVLISGLLWRGYWDDNCVQLVVASSHEKYELLRDIAASYHAPRVERRCVKVTVIKKASGTAERALRRDWKDDTDPRPHVWSPAATTWLLLLSTHREQDGVAPIVPVVAQSLIQSPLVIAMPEPMATTLLQSTDRIGWRDVLSLARDPEGWARFGKPWGRFRLGKTTPLISTSGLHALISLQYAAQVDEVPVTFLQGVESSVLHYADSVGTFLANLRRADRDGKALEYVSAIAVEEKQVFDYNHGVTDGPCDKCPSEPTVKLRAVYPKEGTLIADHPYALLDWPDLDDAHRQAASDFQRHLESRPVQALFQKEGFRDHRRQAGDLLRPPHFDPYEPKTLYALPVELALREMRDFWSEQIRKRANALIVLDIGTSADDYVPALEATKRTLVSRAIDDALRDLGENDVIGLHTFPARDGRSYDEVFPPTELGPRPTTQPGVGLSSIKLVQRLQALETMPGTRTLYAAVRAAIDRVRAGFDPTRVNAVILVSDGGNETSDRVAELSAVLSQQREDERVLVFTVALSSEAAADLQTIAYDSGGAFYDAKDPKKISEAIRNALLNL